MVRRIEWQDDYWLLLIQLYLKKPQGIKHLYSRNLVDLALELHIHPSYIHNKMYRLRQIDTPFLQKLWEEYSNNPRKLKRVVNKMRTMKGFGNADAFYAGVEINESWEKDFKTIEGTEFTPVMLILILDLYFRLTPVTMVAETPEVIELAKLIKSTPKKVSDILGIFLVCDPYMKDNESGVENKSLVDACEEVWKQYGNDDPEKLASLAAQLKEYFS